MDKGVNITAVLESILGTSEINSKEDIELLIQALRSMPEDTKLTPESMAEIAEAIKNSKTDKALA